MTRTTTRRALIGGAGLAAVTAVLPCVPLPAAAAQVGVSNRLRRLLALHDRADKASDRYYAEVEEPARAAYVKDLGASSRFLRREVPHESVVTTFVNVTDDVVRLSTASVGAVAVALKVATDPTWADMGDEEWRRAHRELHAAAQRRERLVEARQATIDEQTARVRDRHRLNEIAERSNALGERRYVIWKAVLNTPSDSVADIAAKLDLAKAQGMEDAVFDTIHADARRVAGRGAA